MSEVDLNGLGVALVTPFKKDYTIDYQSLDKIIDHVICGGCDYLVALGTTAETPTLSDEEKIKVAKFVNERNNGRVPLVIGIGGNNTASVIEAIQTIPLKGYSAILSVTPYYNKPTQEGLYAHFKAICDKSPLPIILYNVPGRTGVNLTSSTTLRLAEYSHKICGIKEASGNIEQCNEIIAKKPSSFSLISGNDSDTTEFMRLGGCGVISVLANAMPEVVKSLVNYCSTKRYNEAQILQTSLTQIIKHLFEDGNPAGVKALLSEMGITENILRLPLTPVSKNVYEKIKQSYSTYTIND